MLYLFVFVMRVICLCVVAYTIKGTTEIRQIRLAAGKIYRRSMCVSVDVPGATSPKQDLLLDPGSVSSRGGRYESFVVAVSVC